MSRDRFGAMGALSSDADLARALAAIGAFYPDVDAHTPLDPRATEDNPYRARTTAAHGTNFTVTLRMRSLQDYLRARLSRVPAGELGHSGDAWLGCWNRIIGTNPPALRFCIDLDGMHNSPELAIDAAWLARLLGRPELRWKGIFYAWPGEQVQLEWNWPLRIAIPHAAWSAGFRSAVDGGRYRELYTLVDLGVPGTGCDLLLIPASLREAVRAALELGAIRASVVIIVGGAAAAPAQTEAWLTALRRQFSAGAAGLAFVPAEERAIWFQSLLAQIAHNATLDVAMYGASRAHDRSHHLWEHPELGAPLADLTTPLLFGDAAFIEAAHMSGLARRIGDAAAGLPDADAPVRLARSFSNLSLGAEVPVRELGTQLSLAASRLAFHQETADAAVLAAAQAGIAAAAGGALEIAPIVTGDLTPEIARFDTGALLGSGPISAAGAGIGAAVGAIVGVLAGPGAGETADRMRSKAPTRRLSRGRAQRSQPQGREPAVPGTVARPPASPAPGPGGEPATAAPPPASSPGRTQRFVLLELFSPSGGDQWGPELPEVSAGLQYAISLFIGEPRAHVVVADTAVDERSLPPSRSGHPLSIAFTPLWRDESGAIPPAQVQRAHLPAEGDSTRASFYFTAPAQLHHLRARVVVLHANRVLQMLMLDAAQLAAAGESPRAELRLRAENVLAEDFGERTQAPAFAAALIVNDSPAGVTGLTAIMDDTATFVEPEGLKLMISDIRKELAALNVADGADPDTVVYGLDDERVHRMLFGLALRGAALAKMLRRQPDMAPFLAAAKLQVVDAVPGAYLPVEFIYDGRAPAPGATRCPRAMAALADLAVHRSCPHNKDENHYCPAAFWGFSRCIERQPYGNQLGYRFAHPRPGANTLQPLRKALLAASRRVRVEDLDGPNGLAGILGGAAAAVLRAQSWDDWRNKVGTEAPSLLVLLPHSLESPTVAHMPALEISGTNIESARMDEEFVCAVPTQNPVVLLLGCSTTLPDVAFLDFVHEFKASGAAVTIGTVATIRGRQTNDFVRELLAEMKLAAAGGARTFDELFLAVKQRLLAKGDPFVLSLVAYGDTGWRIQA